MFRVTQVEYRCSAHDTAPDDGLRVTVHASDWAPMPVLQHPIDRWWALGGRTYRTPLMSGTLVT